MEQVMVRCPQLHGKLTALVLAEVLERRGDMVRIKLAAEQHPREVKAADTVPVAKLYGVPAINTSRPYVMPTVSTPGRNSLASR